MAVSKIPSKYVVGRGTLPTNTDLNDIKTLGAYQLSSTSTYQNAPVSYGVLEVVAAGDPALYALMQRITTTSAIYIRYYTSGTWYSWVQK